MFGLGRPSTKQLEDELFNLKYFAKQLQREAKKADKEMTKEKEKVKKEIEKGRKEHAEIAAANAIMYKNHSINYSKTASRIEAVVGKLNAAIKMQKVTKSISQMTGTMSKVLASMNLADIQKHMDQFEQVLGDTDVMANTVSQSMDSTTAQSTPQSEIEELMCQVADEHQLDVSNMLPDVARKTKVQAPAAAEEDEEDELTKRLNALKAPGGA